MANRYTSLQPYQGSLYTPPVALVGQMLQQQQEKYDQNYALANTIRTNFIPSLPQDRATANTIQQEWEKRADDIVESYNGNYAKASKDLATLTADIRRDYGPGGRAHAITSNYGSYNDWLTRHRERVEKGKVLAEDLNTANSKFLSEYAGVGEIDPVSGTFNQFRSEDLVDYMDPEKIIKDVYSTFKPEKRSVGKSYVGNDGYIHYKKEEIEGIAEDRLNPSFQSALRSNPQYMAYLNQRARIMGVPPEGAEKFVTALASQRARDLSYMNMSSDHKMDTDAYHLARYKAGLDKSNIDYMMSTLRYEPLTPNVGTGAEIGINENNWRGSFDTPILSSAAYGISNTIIEGNNALLDLIGLGKYETKKQVQNTSVAPKESLDSYLTNTSNDNRLLNKNVNPHFARTVWEHTKKTNPEYATKYGKEAKWTNEFETKFWKDYKQAQKQVAGMQSTSFEIPNQAKKGLIESIVPELLTGNASIYYPGNATQRSAKELPSDVLNSMYDSKENKIKDGVLSIKYVLPGPGYAAAGYLIETPKGSFVVPDQNAQRKGWSTMMEQSLNPIFSEGKRRGGKGIAGVDPANGLMYFGTPEMRYEKGVNGWEGNVYWETDPGVFEKRNPAELHQQMIHLFGGSLGFGETKAARTPYSHFFNQ